MTRIVIPADTEVARLREENTRLRADLTVFFMEHAFRSAHKYGLPCGHLHPCHYDRMAELGCRMDGFTRAALSGPAPGEGE
jgi:hypothetical protein